MSRCTRARQLFGPYWDDETTRAEREWLDAHFAECAACRTEYETLSRTLTAVASLPRHEAAPDLAERALAAARRASTAPDRVFAPQRPVWVPVAATAAVALIAVVVLGPRFLGHAPAPTPVAHVPSAAVAEPTLAATTSPAPTGTAPVAVAISDTLFDHTEDVDFVLDPVALHRGRAHTVARLPEGVRGEQAVISF